MESLFKSTIVMLFSIALMAHMVMGAGECGNTSVEAAALKRHHVQRQAKTDRYLFPPNVVL